MWFSVCFSEATKHAMIDMEYTPIPHTEGGTRWHGMCLCQAPRSPEMESDQVGTNTLPAAALLRVFTKSLVKRNYKGLPGPRQVMLEFTASTRVQVTYTVNCMKSSFPSAESALLHGLPAYLQSPWRCCCRERLSPSLVCESQVLAAES